MRKERNKVVILESRQYRERWKRENRPTFLFSQVFFNKQIVQEFMTYTKQDGEILSGLVKRSVAEAMLFIDGNYLEIHMEKKQ